MKILKDKLLNLTVLVMLGAGIWWLSRRIMWLGDDLDYMFRMRGAIWESWGWINTPRQFLESQWSHYLHVNGRFFAHMLVQLFNGVLGQEWFSIFNAIVYPFNVILLSRLGGIRRPTFSTLLTSTILLLLGFMTKMMPTCQIGYIWGLGVNMLWIGLFLSGRQRKPISIVLICLLGLIAGNWQEAYSIGIGGALGVMVLTQWLKHPIRRMSKSQVVFAIFYIIGTASVCLAPSTLSRATAITSGDGTMALVSPPGIVYALFSLRIFYILVGLIIYRIFMEKGSSKNTEERRPFRIKSFVYSQSLWVIAIALLLVFNLLIGVFGNRQLFGIELCSAVLVIRLLHGHTFNRIWLAIGTAAIAGVYIYQFILAMDVRAQFLIIEKDYAASKDGRVYFDRRRASNEGFTREIKIYEDIVGLYDNDPHHSMMKYLRHKHCHRRPLLVIPEGIKTLTFRDTIWSYAPGHYVAIGHMQDTIIMRSGGVLQEIDRPYDFHKSLTGPDGWRILLITPTDPWRTPYTRR